MSQEILSRKTKRNLEVLNESCVLRDFYLAGGTGLTLQIGHRISLDFDFFSPTDFDEKILAQKLKKLGKFSIEKEAQNSLIGTFQSTRITFLTYDYPLLFPLKDFLGIKVADVRDIGCMKIAAISSRGIKKDFIDLFFICQKVISLETLLKLFKKKYKSVDYNMLHILKSLVYFEDGRREPTPRIMISFSWQEVENFFKQEVKKLRTR